MERVGDQARPHAIVTVMQAHFIVLLRQLKGVGCRAVVAADGLVRANVIGAGLWARGWTLLARASVTERLVLQGYGARCASRVLIPRQGPLVCFPCGKTAQS
jgi:hypothetical protein